MKSTNPTKRILFTVFTALFLIAVSVSAISCSSNNSNSGGSANQTGDNSASGTQADDAATTEEEYVYPQMDGGGADFNILAPTTTWFFYTDITHDSMTGDVLDDAIYTRNSFIEDKFNINLKEISKDIGTVPTELKKTILAGSDEYDISFCPAYSGAYIGSLITQNMFDNLRGISTLNLDKDWWNQTMNKEA
ncbi:MAG: hypothetical protein FWD71_15415, partial [Oscillospiraceae bacterium]|nr:hypothetical protein [Oscillospiraceae bacterium]